MMLKTLHLTLDVLVAFSVWCAALLVAVPAWRVVIAGGFAVYHLLHF